MLLGAGCGPATVAPPLATALLFFPFTVVRLLMVLGPLKIIWALKIEQAQMLLPFRQSRSGQRLPGGEQDGIYGNSRLKTARYKDAETQDASQF